MKLIKLLHRVDYGHDWSIHLFNTDKHYPKLIKNYSLLQLSLGWMDYPCGPYLQIHMGQGRLFGLIFFAHKFSVDIDILAPTWRWDHGEER
jgi:hypothetical protein